VIILIGLEVMFVPVWQPVKYRKIQKNIKKRHNYQSAKNTVINVAIKCILSLLPVQDKAKIGEEKIYFETFQSSDKLVYDFIKKFFIKVSNVIVQVFGDGDRPGWRL